ncbi:MAG: zinc ribbon domain-containing protein [Chloroflexi bacterium]|nr:zinc ribbon domain-containing protein [Chloroflexota bacterium]
MTEKIETEGQVEQIRCRCPFCQVETSQMSPFCVGCGLALNFCSACGQPVPKDSEKCPNCGANAE